ncbi:MAG: hypothetical protein RJA70_489, partial [Pseudomonadota bacterium]
MIDLVLRWALSHRIAVLVIATAMLVWGSV